VLISLAVIVVLAVGSVVAGFFFLRRAVTDRIQVEETAGGQKVSVNLPGGKVSLAANEEITEEKLGVPIYPGAKAEKGAGSLTISGADEKSAGSFSGATFTTTDSFDEVVAFYKDKLSDKVNVVESTNDGKRVCVLTVSSDRGWKNITIEDQESDGAKIVVASVTGRPKP
jgi:hypothetical protein